MPLIQVTMAAGRTAEQKRALLSAVTEAVHTSIGAPVASIRVWIVEMEPNEFMAGGELLADRWRRVERGRKTMPGYIIMDAEVTDPAGYQEFKRIAGAAIARAGGRFLIRGGDVEALEGDWHPRVIVLEFPTYEHALTFYRSDDYQKAREVRLRSATARVLAAEGLPVDGEAEERRRMEQLIRRYFDACNAADVEAITACFVPEAVHYFPPGMYDGPFRGARVIAERWRAAVETIGSYWTIDRLVCDPARHQAVIEWTHFKTKQGVVLRGDEWYVFDPSSGLIKEIRAYYASPQDPNLSRMELGGFDYVAGGYPIDLPDAAHSRPNSEACATRSP